MKGLNSLLREVVKAFKRADENFASVSGAILELAERVEELEEYVAGSDSGGVGDR